jgi:hypothetical protein
MELSVPKGEQCRIAGSTPVNPNGSRGDGDLPVPRVGSRGPSGRPDPSYPDVCLDPNAEDDDCAGGSGNGPRFVEGPTRVRPPDPFDLDREGDGWGCERG